MKAYKAEELRQFYPGSRSHPWTTAMSNDKYTYVDFKAEPHLIETSLDDLRPFDAHESVQHFYKLLLWLNGPHCRLETNDCAFKCPHPNTPPDKVWSAAKLRCSGRLMLLFRELGMNLSYEHTTWLLDAYCYFLSLLDKDWDQGIAGLLLVPTYYRTLKKQRNGMQLVIEWWVWGDTTADVMEQYGRCVSNLESASRLVNEQIGHTLNKGAS